MEFRFAEEQPQDDYAAELADNLLVYPPEHIIYGDYAFKVWDEEMIEYILGFLKNMRIDIVSKSFAKSQGNLQLFLVCRFCMYIGSLASYVYSSTGSLNVIRKKIYFLFAGWNRSKWFPLHNI